VKIVAARLNWKLKLHCQPGRCAGPGAPDWQPLRVARPQARVLLVVAWS